MKNLQKERRKAWLCVALTCACFLAAILLPLLLNAVIPAIWPRQRAVLAAAVPLVFWAGGAVLFLLTFKKLILLEWFAHHDKTLRADRVSFPSSDGTFDTEKMAAALTADDFTVTKTPYGFTANRIGKPAMRVEMVENESLFTPAERPTDTKHASVALTCFVRSEVTDEEKEKAKTVEGDAAFCDITAYLETSSGRAYFPGAVTRSMKSEYAAREVFVHDLLRLDKLPPKTASDKTPEELAWEREDAVRDVKEALHGTKENREIAATLTDGELRVERSGAYGTLFFRVGKVVVSHPFSVCKDETWIIPDPAYAYTLTPKVRACKKDEADAFRDAIEARLAKDAVTFKYE